MQDEYIDEDGDIWVRVGEGIAWRENDGGLDGIEYRRINGAWFHGWAGRWVAIPSATAYLPLDAAWAALKGETQKAPCGATEES